MEDDPKIGEGAGPRALNKALPPHETSTADRARAVEFPVALRGYDREAVDRFVAEMADLVEMLESRQARETVVQRALEEVGEETSAILKQAHETADDITARSRSKAEDRAEIARQEAAAITREARIQASELKRETEGLQVERANIIEELRRFATDTLALAEAAADRLDPSLPEEDPAHPEEALADARDEGIVDDPGDDRPYDRSDELGLDDEWEDAEEDPGPPTEELAISSDEQTNPPDEPTISPDEPTNPPDELAIPTDRREAEPPPTSLGH